MHIVAPSHIVSEAPLVFRGERGEQLRISILDHDIVRVRMWPDGEPRLDRTWLVLQRGQADVPLEGRRRDDPCQLADYELATTADGVLDLRTDQLQVTINLDPFRLQWHDREGRCFAADLVRRAYAYDRRGRSVFHYMERRDGERYYGFGEKSGPLDKAGMRLRMGNMDAFGYDAAQSDPLYKHVPFYITYVPDLDIAYGLFYDNLAACVFDMGKEVNALRGARHRFYQAEDGDLDYYFIYGPTIEAVIEKYTLLTGRPTLPPRWTLGYLGSTMTYTEAPDAQEQLKRFVDLCHEHRISCDMFHLSSGYTTDGQGRRCVFTWNPNRVPEPAKMVEHFRMAGIHVAANVKPYLMKIHPRYDELLSGFVRNTQGDGPEVHHFWSGGAYEFEDGAFVDFTNPDGFAWWKARVTDALLAYGIDAVWNDNNEFEIADDEAQCDGFGQPIRASLARPLLTLLMGRASFEAMRDHQPDERPFLLSRAGCPGIQRYAQTWTGDNTTAWRTLRWNLPMGLGLGLSGMPNNGHDVGGFAGPAPDPELLLRWVQLGVFLPRFTIHSWNDDGSVNEPWMYPSVLPLVREAINFRYRLIPYLYSLLAEAAQTGHPIARPLVYHFPEDTQTESFDFMLGPQLLVAPIMEPGQRNRDVYLPQGTNWHDFRTGARYTGGQTIVAKAPLERIPLYVPEGGLVPTGRLMRYVGERPDDLRRVYVFPHRGEGQATFALIEDDGVTAGGPQSRVQLSVEATAREIALSCDVSGEYALPYHEIEFVLPPGETRRVRTGRQSGRGIDDQGRRQVILPLND